MFKLLACICLLYQRQTVFGFTLSTSSERLTVGTAFTFTCHPNTVPLVLVFRSDNHRECQITTISDGSCKVDNNNPEFVCTCNHVTKNYTLTIPGSYYNDSYHNSIWKCRDLAGGGQSNNITLFINDPISSVNITPTSEDVPVGSTRSLTCITNPGRPTARIQWYISNGTGERNLTSLASQSPNCYPGCDHKTASNSTLVYTGFRIDDQYNISCIASNIDGRTVRSQNSTINILYGPDEVNITPTYIPYIVIEGGRVGPINCSADCKPDCTRTWIGANLPDGSTSVLYLQNINRHQTGGYQCNASNAFGSSMSTVIDIRVQYEPTIENIANQTVNEGGNIVIMAKITANPNATLVWWTRESDTTFLQNSTDLAIMNISRNQNGTYLIHATNTMTPSGQTEQLRTVVERIVITVNYSPTIHLEPVYDPLIVYEGQQNVVVSCVVDDAKPSTNIKYNWTLPEGITNSSTVSFIKINRSFDGDYFCSASNSVGYSITARKRIRVQYEPSFRNVTSQAITEGYNVTIQADILETPSPTTVWWTCVNDPLFRQNGSALIIDNINRSQDGTYIVHATYLLTPSGQKHIEKKVEKRINITVWYSPSVLIHESPVYEVFENDKLELHCSVKDANPNVSVIYWYADSFSNELSKSATLSMDHVKREQNGTYRCIGYNGIEPNGTTAIYVNVLFQSDIVNITVDDNVFEGNKTIITCTAEGNPSPIVTWSYVQNGTSIEESHFTNKTYSLTSEIELTSAKCEDSGTYRCHTDNELNKPTNKTVEVSVQCPPRPIVLDNRNVTISRNGSLNLTVMFTAVPQPTFLWIFNNTNLTDFNTSFVHNTLPFLVGSNLMKNDFKDSNVGHYDIYATNPLGTSSETFNIIFQRQPDVPLLIGINCVDVVRSVKIDWKSTGNGGLEQHFNILYKTEKQNITIVSQDILESRHDHVYTEIISNLKENEVYIFSIKATNDIDYVLSSSINCSVLGEEQLSSPLPIIGGVSGSVFGIIAVFIILLVYKKRRSNNQQNQQKLIQRKTTPDNDDDEGGLKDNPMYVSSDTTAIYSQSSKKGDFNQRTEKKDNKKNEQGVYGKASKKERSDKTIEMGCVYENSKDFLKEEGNSIYANAENRRSKDTEYRPQKNKDGLIYADLDLAPISADRKFVIRGLDNKSNYAVIDLSKNAEPLPSDDEEENTNNSRDNDHH